MFFGILERHCSWIVIEHDDSKTQAKRDDDDDSYASIYLLPLLSSCSFRFGLQKAASLLSILLPVFAFPRVIRQHGMLPRSPSRSLWMGIPTENNATRRASSSPRFTTVQQIVEEGCNLAAVDDIAAAIHRMLCLIQAEATAAAQ
ncbi:hypothetical protein MUK42_05614 [Musa troglodytarum]|uniref:Uncharacterized protein n=1 Tax=Musa troglodytarum TaxID=320322 RepID=A0A9E7ETJ4_9LILI|nr:hypothetical protein MUK42_05614 [Musa troglodytarum]